MGQSTLKFNIQVNHEPQAIQRLEFSPITFCSVPLLPIICQKHTRKSGASTLEPILDIAAVQNVDHWTAHVNLYEKSKRKKERCLLSAQEKYYKI